MIYLFLGEDSLSKDIKLKKLKEEFLPSKIEDFNFDTLYARELNLQGLQERILSLPVRATKRMIVVKDAQDLKEDIREFILKYARHPFPNILLVLEMIQKDRKDAFIEDLSRYACVCRFKESPHLDTFSLSRQIDFGRTDYALRVLSQLLRKGEKPERILGGLRYACEKDFIHRSATKRKLRFLLDCDIEIKKGRLKPNLALEKLVVKLCCLKNSLR